MSKSELIGINQTALDWWRGLTVITKAHFCTKHLSPTPLIVNITMAQILSIYNKEVNDGQDVPKEKPLHSIGEMVVYAKDWLYIGDKAIATIQYTGNSEETKLNAARLCSSWNDHDKLKRDNAILLEALNKISKYNGDGLTDKAIAINVITIADIALFQTMGNSTKEKSHV